VRRLKIGCCSGLAALAFTPDAMSDLPDRVLANLRALCADVNRFPEIPHELAEWIARRTSEDLDGISRDVRDLERIGLLPPDTASMPPRP
jgi:hypothetical protein